MTDSNQVSKGQQYNLKWTNYTNNMVQVFSDHLVQESLVDVTLVCEGHLIKAHKIILSACSFYFREIFEMYTDRQPLIILNGVRFTDLKQLIEFMYRGEVKVQDADVETLLQLAETLQVKGLCNVREKSGGVLPTETCIREEVERKKGTSQKPATTLADANAASCNTGALKNTIDVDLQTSIKTEPGLSVNYDSGDDSPLVIDESAVDTSLKTLLSDFSGNEPKAKKMKISKQGATKKVRPPNAFMIFTNEWREKLKKQYPNESNKSISIKLGNKWKSLSQYAKDRYYEAATKANTAQKARYLTGSKVENSTIGSEDRDLKYYEAIQLVKLVMPDDNKVDSASNEVEIVDTQSMPSNISNGDNKNQTSVKDNL